MSDNTVTGSETPTERPEPSLLRALWRTLQSVRTTIYLLIIIAAATTIGAVIPQERPPEYYEMVYGARWGRLLTGLGFDNLYGSTWFVIAIVFVELVTLVVCW